MSRDVVVEIERNNVRKPYLGGIRHRMTGTEYHHASAQTLAPQRPDKGIVRYARDTQTIQSRHRVIQTTNEQSTQMSKPGYYVSTDSDRLLTPHRYQTADERFEILTKKVRLKRIHCVESDESSSLGDHHSKVLSSLAGETRRQYITGRVSSPNSIWAGTEAKTIGRTTTTLSAWSRPTPTSKNERWFRCSLRCTRKWRPSPIRRTADAFSSSS